MLHQSSDEITFVLYASDKKSKSIVIKRSHLARVVFLLISILVIMSVTIVSLILRQKRKAFYEFDNFSREQLYLKEREELLGKIKLLTDENLALVAKTQSGQPVPPVATIAKVDLAKVTPTPEKTAIPVMTPIAQDVASSQAVNDIFSFVKRPIGFKNIEDRNLIKVDNIQVRMNNRGAFLSFDLINNSPDETKITGYALVISRSSLGGVSFYPTNPAYVNVNKVPYNTGEQFGFSRMRPVSANFKLRAPSMNNFTILVFSRAGDLILKKDIGPYELK